MQKMLGMMAGFTIGSIGTALFLGLQRGTVPDAAFGHAFACFTMTLTAYLCHWLGLFGEREATN